MIGHHDRSPPEPWQVDKTVWQIKGSPQPGALAGWQIKAGLQPGTLAKQLLARNAQRLAAPELFGTQSHTQAQ